MSRKNNKILRVVHDIFDVCFDHGWGEDAREYLQYNDPGNIDSMLENCIHELDRKKLDSHVERFRWDEEYDLKYDDMGIASFAQSLGEVFRKHQLVEVPKGKFKVESSKRVSTTYTVKCPVCSTRHSSEDGTGFDSCRNCGAEWEVSSTT